MSQIAINVPDTLMYQLENTAQKEGVPLDQYIVFILTRQTMLTPMIYKVPEKDIQYQSKDFYARMEKLGKASQEDLEKVLQERECVEPEPDISPEIISKLKNRIAEARRLG